MSPSQDKLRTRATGIGALAVLMWSLLAPLTVAAAGVPPLQLLATSFALACAFGFVWLAATGRWQRLRQPLAFWLFATAALFGYHLLYFVALSLAPPAQANLVNYLWPLLIVLLSAFGTGQRLRARHVAGAVLALGGTVLLLLSRDDVQMAAPNRTAGLLAALGCAIVAFGTDPVGQAAEVLTRSGGDGPESWATEIDLLATQFRGYAVLDDPHDPGLRAIAAPVIGASEHVRMAVEIQGPTSRIPEDRFDELGSVVRGAASALEGLPISVAFGDF